MNVNERYTWCSVCDGYSDVGLKDGINTGDAVCQLVDYENTGLSPSEIANAVLVVKCKDCKFYGNGDCKIQAVMSMYPNDYCSYGEKIDNNMENKIKAIDPKIFVKKVDNKPYYSIEYYNITDNKWHIGYGSYNLDNVIEWLKSDFEIVEADVVPLYHSKWIPKSSDGNDYLDPRCKCSHCGSLETPLIKHKYCPSCGAKTDLRELERTVLSEVKIVDKVYIVTSGEYSDYHIEKVFKSEENAKKYIEARNNKYQYDYASIETYEFNDNNLDVLIAEGKFIRGDVEFDKEPAIWLDYECKSPDKYMILGEKDEYCYITHHNNSYELFMGKLIPKDKWENDKSIEKFKKILTDKVSEIKSMLADGMTWDMINEILKESI